MKKLAIPWRHVGRSWGPESDGRLRVAECTHEGSGETLAQPPGPVPLCLRSGFPGISYGVSGLRARSDGRLEGDRGGRGWSDTAGRRGRDQGLAGSSGGPGSEWSRGRVKDGLGLATGPGRRPILFKTGRSGPAIGRGYGARRRHMPKRRLPYWRGSIIAASRTRRRARCRASLGPSLVSGALSISCRASSSGM